MRRSFRRISYRKSSFIILCSRPISPTSNMRCPSFKLHLNHKRLFLFSLSTRRTRPSGQAGLLCDSNMNCSPRASRLAGWICVKRKHAACGRPGRWGAYSPPLPVLTSPTPSSVPHRPIRAMDLTKAIIVGTESLEKSSVPVPKMLSRTRRKFGIM